MTSVIAFIFVFGILVIAHEFGHYILAKRAGVLVREFAIGFGPKLFNYKGGETTYTLRILPFGGYVRLAGGEEDFEFRPGLPATLELTENNTIKTIDVSQELQTKTGLPMEVTDADLEYDMYIEGVVPGKEGVTRYSVERDADVIEEDGTSVQVAPIERQVQSASLLNRLLINFAGPFNNIILAMVIFSIIAFIQGGVFTSEPEIGEVIENSPAEEAGLQEGDQVLAVDGQEMETFQEIAAYIQQRPGEEIVIEIENAQSGRETVTVLPEEQEVESGETIGLVGIQAPMAEDFWSKLSYGWTQTWSIIGALFTAIWDMVTGNFSLDMLGGPVAIFATTSTAVSGGIAGLLSWMAYLSINLGIINLLPIPALDGGKIVINLIEGVLGRPVSEKAEVIVTLIGVAFIFTLMIAVTWNDIQRFFLQ